VADYRILITGSRDWDDDPLLCLNLAMAVQEPRSEGFVVIIVHGACPRGADKTADVWARNHRLRVERHPADWDRHGKSAGFVRNAEMVSLGADLCLAFLMPCTDGRCRRPGRHYSHGASHCAQLAEANSIPVRRITDG